MGAVPGPAVSTTHSLPQGHSSDAGTCPSKPCSPGNSLSCCCCCIKLQSSVQPQSCYSTSCSKQWESAADSHCSGACSSPCTCSHPMHQHLHMQSSHASAPAHAVIPCTSCASVRAIPAVAETHSIGAASPVQHVQPATPAMLIPYLSAASGISSRSNVAGAAAKQPAQGCRQSKDPATAQQHRCDAEACALSAQQCPNCSFDSS